MACFIVPVAEAVVTTIITKVVKSKEKEEKVKVSFADGVVEDTTKIKFSTKLGWLNKLLWGGSALLAFEHIWHGEVVPFFPFLTAIQNGETADMFAEMFSTGVTMSVLVTAIWVCMLIVSHIIEKRAVHEVKLTEETL
jgi:hypothetical protein